MAKRNDVGVRPTTRTGPFQGPGMRTRYSSPTFMGPSWPCTLVNRAELRRRHDVGIGGDPVDQRLGVELGISDLDEVAAVEQRPHPPARRLQALPRDTRRERRLASSAGVP